MGIVVIGLVVVVGLMAIGRRSTVDYRGPSSGSPFLDQNGRPLDFSAFFGTPGPSDNVPASGLNPVISPATGSGPFAARSNTVRIGMVYQNAYTKTVETKVPKPGAFMNIPEWLTDAQSSLRTQDVPPLVKTESPAVTPVKAFRQPYKY